MREIKFHADSKDVFLQREKTNKIDSETQLLRVELATRLAVKIQSYEKEAAEHRLCGRKEHAAKSLEAAKRLRAFIK